MLARSTVPLGRKLDAGRKAVLLTTLFIGLCVLSRLYIGQVPDVSWLIVVCEKLLHGQRLYVDIMETNPPFSVALYFGPVWLSHHVGLTPEAAVEIYVFMIFLLSMLLTAAVVRHGPLARQWEWSRICPVLTGLLLVLPGKAFGQREHIGMMLFMPMLAMMMWRADPRHAGKVPLGLAVATGLAASVLILVKPHWALGIALPYTVICWRRRSIAACFTPENLVIGAVVLSYAAVLFLFYDAYLQSLLPTLLKYYVASRHPINLVFIGPAFIVFAAFIIMQQKASGWHSDVVIAMAAATGFAISVILLGKYWTNHMYPYLVTISVATLMAVVARYRSLLQLHRRIPRGELVGCMAGAVAVAAFCVGTHYHHRPGTALVDSIRTRFEAPTILQVGNDLSAGNPLTRMVNGRWLSIYAHDWLGANALSAVLDGALDGPSRQEALQVVAQHTEYINSVIRDERPDIILINKFRDKPQPPLWVAWMQENADFQRLMEDYQEVFPGPNVRVFARRSSDRQDMANAEPGRP